jgi:hypothetical protein
MPLHRLIGGTAKFRAREEHQTKFGGGNQQRIAGISQIVSGKCGTRVHSKTLSFFGASGVCSIDFGQFAPMFRLDAARYRNAIS